MIAYACFVKIMDANIEIKNITFYNASKFFLGVIPYFGCHL